MLKYLKLFLLYIYLEFGKTKHICHWLLYIPVNIYLNENPFSDHAFQKLYNVGS